MAKGGKNKMVMKYMQLVKWRNREMKKLGTPLGRHRYELKLEESLEFGLITKKQYNRLWNLIPRYSHKLGIWGM